MINVGLLGAGRIAGVHATAITRHPESTLVAVSDYIPANAKKIAADLVAHPGIALVAGGVPLLLGTFLVLVHNTWTWNWDVIVTIAGWLLFVVGLFRLWCVDVWIDVMKKHKDTAALRAGLIVFVIGILLIYVGFFR